MVKDGVFEAYKPGKLKKLQITHRIDNGLRHKNPREYILTSIESA